jgi:hypothetical protein
MRITRAASVLGLAVASIYAGAVFAASDWADLATISPTTTLRANHACFSNGKDIACDYPLNNVEVSGTLELQTLSIRGVAGGVPVSITNGAAADNLGNHTATQNLDMGGFDITNVNDVAASGSVQVGDTGVACSVAGDLGKITYDTASGKFRICRP